VAASIDSLELPETKYLETMEPAEQLITLRKIVEVLSTAEGYMEELDGKLSELDGQKVSQVVSKIDELTKKAYACLDKGEVGVP
jgi:hypothetical protein